MWWRFWKAFNAVFMFTDTVYLLKPFILREAKKRLEDGSLPPPVAETGGQNVGNRKKRFA